MINGRWAICKRTSLFHVRNTRCAMSNNTSVENVQVRQGWHERMHIIENNDQLVNQKRRCIVRYTYREKKITKARTWIVNLQKIINRLRVLNPFSYDLLLLHFFHYLCPACTRTLLQLRWLKTRILVIIPRIARLLNIVQQERLLVAISHTFLWYFIRIYTAWVAFVVLVFPSFDIETSNIGRMSIYNYFCNYTLDVDVCGLQNEILPIHSCAWVRTNSRRCNISALQYNHLMRETLFVSILHFRIVFRADWRLKSLNVKRSSGRKLCATFYRRTDKCVTVNGQFYSPLMAVYRKRSSRWLGRLSLRLVRLTIFFRERLYLCHE